MATRDAAAMKKRIAAGLLWFYATWYAASLLSLVTAVPDLLGPTLGLVLGVFVAWDPTNRIWSRFPARQTADAAPAPVTLEPDAA